MNVLKAESNLMRFLEKCMNKLGAELTESFDPANPEWMHKARQYLELQKLWADSYSKLQFPCQTCQARQRRGKKKKLQTQLNSD